MSKYAKDINGQTVVYVSDSGDLHLNTNDGRRGLDQAIGIPEALAMIGALGEAIKVATASASEAASTPEFPADTVIGGGMVNGLPADAVRLIREEMQRAMQAYENNATQRITDLIEAKVTEKVRLRTENGMFRDAVEQVVRHVAHNELEGEVKRIVEEKLDTDSGDADTMKRILQQWVDGELRGMNFDDAVQSSVEMSSWIDDYIDNRIENHDDVGGVNENRCKEIANECINNASFSISVQTDD